MATVNNAPISISVASTDRYARCKETLTQSDTGNAYPLVITWTDLTAITGSAVLRFGYADGTYLDRDASDGVTVEANTVSYVLDEQIYALGAFSLFVRFLDGTTLYTALRIDFTSVQLLPGTSSVPAAVSYPAWAADMIDYDIDIGTVTTLAAGADATAEITGAVPDKVLNLGIPEGDKGDKGDAATIAVGTVTTLAAGESATVGNSGTSGAAVLDFGIPEGDKGDKGDAATIAVGTVSTLAAGQSATVANSGTSGAAVLDFGIPQGLKGDTGDAGTITAGSTNTTMTGLIAGNGTKIAAPTAAQVGALPMPDPGNLFAGYDQLVTQMQSVGAQLAQIETEPSFKSTAALESAALGSELIDDTGWTTTGWTGSFAAGFTHTPGNTSALTRTMTGTGTKYYQISFDTSASLASSSLELLVSIGNSVGFELYRGSITNYVVGIRSVSDGNLTFTPVTGFDKTISNISVKEITGTFNAPMTFVDSASGQSFEMRPTLASLGNTYIGQYSGKRNTTGNFNVGMGYKALADNTTGYWNVAIGNESMAANNTGSRNVALGNLSLIANISGHRNVAIGSFALYRNTHGANNIALGADCLWYNTTGNYNIGLGLSALSANTTGSDNIALGAAALAANISGLRNFAVGDHAMTTSATGDDNIAMGYQSLYTANGAAKNISIGYNAMQKTTTGGGNICLGEQVKYKNTTGLNSIAIGYYAMYNGNESYSIAIGSQALYSSASVNGGNVAIGDNAAFTNSTGEFNVALGFQALNKNTVGKENVAIGKNAGLGSANGELIRNVLIGYNAGSGLAGGGNYNTIIGAASGTTLTTGASNIIIGYNCQAPAVDSASKLNIGNTLYGDLSAKRIGINVDAPTAKLHLPASTTAASTAPIKITAGVLMTTAEAGAIEFDGTNLYFTDSTGARKTLAVAA